MRKGTVVFLVCSFLMVGSVLAQDTVQMLQELKAMVQKNTAEIEGLKRQLAAKDQVIATQETKIKALEGQTTKSIESIDQRIDTILQEEKVVAAGPRGEFGLLFGGQSSVFKHDAGYLMGGFYDPVILAKDPFFGNRLSGEIMATFCRQTTPMDIDPQLGEVYDFLNLAFPAVFPNNAFRHQEQVNVDLETLSLILGAKYRVETLGKIKPYMAGGLGMYVFAMDLDSNYTVGQVPPAQELARHGYPAGNADLEWGVNFGGGVEYQITDLIAIGFDGRYNWTTGGKKTDFGTYCGFVSFNF